MYLNTCVSFLLLGLVVVQALPASKFEKKSVTDQGTPATKILELKEIGDDKNRDKKSIPFSYTEKTDVQVFKAEGVPQAQDCNNQQGQQSAQTLNVIQGTQLVPQQSFIVPQQMVPQQSYMVPQQIVPQQVLTQQVVSPVQTLQIIQPSRPCHPRINVKVFEDKPLPTPAPTTPAPTPKEIKVESVPETKQTEKMIAPQMERFETFNMVPVAPVCKEELIVVPQKPLVVVPEPTVVKVPNCSHGSHQGIVTQCSCGQQAVSAVRTNGVTVDQLMAMRAPALNGPYSGRMATDYHVSRHF
ncbi:PREDICTED: uncharacterized protein LOC107187036 [Dufourea novaeangliae]|uniref:Uncharacterized protein n=1 Tax=Dufourea novaeangliae TaxID=178035 RepID=A0A154PA22_DUFNO|nr:PREDICTED: uncharacterized protein LOC107187036 [Dufourea novaeangliae]KZC08786.1 hypothetical protein WN55_11289 [Dufourea novaeangliae]